MKIYNEDKTKELLMEDCDLTKGYFSNIFYEHEYREAIEEIPEQGHYQIVKEYPNGGKDVEWVVDIPKVEGRESFIEDIPCQCYIQYTEEELIQQKKDELLSMIKQSLADSDYLIIRFLEGTIKRDRYVWTKKQRETWREIIKKIEVCNSYEQLFQLEEEYKQSLSTS